MNHSHESIVAAKLNNIVRVVNLMSSLPKPKSGGKVLPVASRLFYKAVKEQKPQYRFCKVSWSDEGIDNMLLPLISNNVVLNGGDLAGKRAES